VLLIGDLGSSMSEPVSEAASMLTRTWGADWQGPGREQPSLTRISTAIEALRVQVLTALHSLD
jgi:hypothetical protein